MSLEIGLVAVLIALEIMCFNDVFQDTLYIGIEDVHRKFATLCCIENSLILLVLSWLKHIVASLHCSHGIIAGIPVGNVHSLPSPFITYDGGK